MKKFLSIALSIIMALCVMPAGVAFAGGESTVTAGTPVTVTLTQDGDTYILYFTPTRTSTYRIASHTQNMEDPKCDIFDSKGEPVASCDDVEGDVRNNNFIITQQLQKGEEYTIVCGGNNIKDGITYTVDIVDTTPAAPPAVPTNLTAVDITPNSISIKWDAVDGAAKYVVYDPSTTPATAKEITDTQYTLTNLKPKTEYNIMVASMNEEGMRSQSTQITVTTPALWPSVPQDLKVTDITYNSFKVTWSASSNTVSYKVSVTGNSADITADVKDSEYTASNLKPNTTYTFSVAAVNEEGVASSAATVTVTTKQLAGIKPSAPTGYNVYGRGNGGKSLYLEWTADKNADGYRVYMVSGGKDYLQGEVKDSKYTFTNLVPSWEYNVKVVAYNDFGESSSTTIICAAPAAPVGFTAAVSGNSINASWDVASCHGYYIQWSTDGTFKTVNGGEFITGSGNTSYTINNIDTSKTYYVRVRTWKIYQDSRLYSDFTAPVEAGIKPSAPTGYNVYGRGNGGKSLYLEWTADKNADGYRVYMVSGGKDYLQGEVTESKYTFTNLVPSWEYNVKVVAYNDFGESSSTTIICAAPAAPVGFTATVSGNSINASWDVASCHGYYIQWSTDETFDTVIGGEFITGSGNTSYTINNIDTSKTYYVRVRTWKIYQDSRLYSDFTAPVEAVVKPSAPTGYNVYGRGDGGKSLYLEWTADKNADGYRVYMVSGGKDYLQGEVTDSKYTFTNLVPSWEYNVKVVAYNDFGESSSTTIICAAPAAPVGFTAAVSGNSINASWDVASCHGYYIQWSTDETFDTVIGGEFITGSGNTSYTINNIDTSKTYYVRVRTWKIYQDSRLYSDFTAPVSVK